jgi:hypothetical protein
LLLRKKFLISADRDIYITWSSLNDGKDPASIDSGSCEIINQPISWRGIFT